MYYLECMGVSRCDALRAGFANRQKIQITFVVSLMSLVVSGIHPSVGETATGKVFEQQIQISYQQSVPQKLRRVLTFFPPLKQLENQFMVSEKLKLVCPIII